MTNFPKKFIAVLAVIVFCIIPPIVFTIDALTGTINTFDFVLLFSGLIVPFALGYFLLRDADVDQDDFLEISKLVVTLFKEIYMLFFPAKE